MVTIKQKLQDFGNGALKVGNDAAALAGLHGAKDQRAQVEKAGQRVDAIYSAIGQKAHQANAAMEKKGENALSAPIAKMQSFNIAPVAVTGTKGQQAKAKVRNGLAKYHTIVAREGEALSRQHGELAHSIASAVLSPIRFVARLLQVEVAGALIQNSIALAVGFAVRGIVLGMTQLGHLVPYITAAAVATGIGAAVYFGGSALVGAVGITFAVLGTLYAIDKLVTGGVILNLNKKVKALAGQAAANPAHTAGSTVLGYAKAGAKKLANVATAPVRLVARNPKKSAALATAAAIGAAGYFYGVPPVVSETFSNLARYFGFAPSLEQVATTEATDMVTRMAKAGHDVSNGVFEQVKAVLLDPKGSIPASMQVANIVTAAPAA